MLKQILAAAAVFVFAGMVMSAPASAASRLTVKDSSSAIKFNVGDDGTVVTTSQLPAATALLANNNDLGNGSGSLVRFGVRGDGISYWQLGSATAEYGQIMYTTPSAYPGIALYTTGWANQSTWANFGTYTAFYHYANRNVPQFVITNATNNVGVGQFDPKQKFEVNGGIRLNPAQVVTGANAPRANYTTAAPTRPNCDANAEGTLWYQPKSGTTGGILSLCGQSGAAAYSWFNLKAF